MVGRWLDEHREKINLLGNAIQEIATRLELLKVKGLKKSIDDLMTTDT